MEENNGPFEEQPQEQGAVRPASQENVGLGAVGALLGSVAGVALIVVFGRIGVVSAFAGFVMSFVALKGYEKFAGGISKKGVLVSVVILVVMTFVADWIDWGFVVAESLNMSVPEAISFLPDLLDAGLIDMGGYLGNLALLYVFVAIGAAAVIVPALRSGDGA